MEDDASLRSRIATTLTAGQVLDLIPDQPIHTLLEDSTMRSWGRDHDVDATSCVTSYGASIPGCDLTRAVCG